MHILPIVHVTRYTPVKTTETTVIDLFIDPRHDGDTNQRRATPVDILILLMILMMLMT